MSEKRELQTNVSPMIAKHSFKPLKDCKNIGEALDSHEFRERIEASVPQHVQPGRLLRTFTSAVSKTPLLAQADIRSFIGACLTASQVGLEPNTPLGHLWLIPFKGKHKGKEVVNINVIFGYPGLLDLSFRTTLVKSIHADVVYPGDDFSFEYGTNAHLTHRPTGRHKEDTAPIWAYMHASLRDGQAFEVMPYDDVLRIRDRAQAYKAALAARDYAKAQGWKESSAFSEAPWVRHEIAMARKTAFRAGSKWLPRSVELASAIALDEAQDRRRRMDFSNVMDAPTIDGTPDYLGAAVDAAQIEEDEDRRDPGSTYSVRDIRDTTIEHVGTLEPTPPDVAQERLKEALEDRTAEADRATQTARQDGKGEIPDPTSADFDAVVINQFGEVTDNFTDPTTWARELLRTWHGCAENERETLLEHNADAIEEARRTPAALKVLLGLEEAPSASTEVVKIEPPMERGKINWPQYVRAIKAGIGFFKTTEELLAFCDQQRAHLIAAPMGQRVPAMRTILAALSAKGGKAPDWFSTLMSTNQAGKPIADVKPDPGQEVTKTADDRLVDGWIADMEKITLTEDFDALARTTPVKTVMARLRRENPALFERADQAFGKKFQELTASPPEAG